MTEVHEREHDLTPDRLARAETGCAILVLEAVSKQPRNSASILTLLIEKLRLPEERFRQTHDAANAAGQVRGAARRRRI